MSDEKRAKGSGGGGKPGDDWFEPREPLKCEDCGGLPVSQQVYRLNLLCSGCVEMRERTKRLRTYGMLTPEQPNLGSGEPSGLVNPMTPSVEETSQRIADLEEKVKRLENLRVVEENAMTIRLLKLELENSFKTISRMMGKGGDLKDERDELKKRNEVLWEENQANNSEIGRLKATLRTRNEAFEALKKRYEISVDRRGKTIEKLEETQGIAERQVLKIQDMKNALETANRLHDRLVHRYDNVKAELERSNLYLKERRVKHEETQKLVKDLQYNVEVLARQRDEAIANSGVPEMKRQLMESFKSIAKLNTKLDDTERNLHNAWEERDAAMARAKTQSDTAEYHKQLEKVSEDNYQDIKQRYRLLKKSFTYYARHRGACGISFNRECSCDLQEIYDKHGMGKP